MVDGQSQFITSKGYWYVAAFPSLASGKIENFASPGELASAIPYLPDTALRNVETGTLPIPVNKVGGIPMEVAVPIVNRLVQVEQDINAFRRKHTLAFGRLHEMLADDKELVEWTQEDFVPKVFGIPYDELPIAGRLAIDRFANEKEHGVFASKLRGKTESIWLQPRQDMRLKSQVMDWARMYQESAAKAALGKDVKEELLMNPLSAFITKAHRLILKSRKIRSPTTIGLLGPSAESGQGGDIRPIETGETLNKNDKIIVRLLFDVSQMMPPLVHDEAHSICSLIYRAIGAYPNLPLGKKVARLFLQELGVVSPWTNRKLNQYQFRLPGLGVWPYQDRLLAKAEASNKDLSVFQDSVEHARKDWSQMPVYCIDSEDAVEIDDGISIERDMKRPDCAWIHVHIANPAAYISRDHPIAISAKETVSSTYTPSRKFAMMPPDFAQKLSSLAPGRPAMTVSTLLEADGSVTDIDISLGILHNVVKLTPDAVDESLVGSRRELATMVVGGSRPARKDDGKNAEALKRALPDLLLMRQFLSRRFSKRFQDWPEEERMNKSPAVVRSNAWTSFKEEPSPLSSDKIAHWKGDPVIVVEGDRFPRIQSNFDFTPLVEHAMLLAGESAAKWCKDREIPILFQVATPHPLYPVSKLNQLEDTDFRYDPAGRLSAKPQPHWSLNMWQYAKITSPIRRYTDLINQWQIQGYLDAVNRGAHDRNGAKSSNPVSTLPFTRHELDGCSKRYGEMLSILRRAANLTTEHWICQAFFRAFHFKEAELPEIWDFMVIGPRQNMSQGPEHTGILGYLSPFHANAELLFSEEQWEKNLKRNQFLPVKIEVVDAELDTILVRAVGLPSDTPTTAQPIHIRPSKKFVVPDENSPERQQR
jgi:RNB domain